MHQSAPAARYDDEAAEAVERAAVERSMASSGAQAAWLSGELYLWNETEFVFVGKLIHDLKEYAEENIVHFTKHPLRTNKFLALFKRLRDVLNKAEPLAFKVCYSKRKRSAPAAEGIFL